MQSLVKLSRLETGIIEICEKDTKIFEVLGLAVAAVVPGAEAKEISVHVDCPETLKLFCDAKWTQEAIFNLLENAGRFPDIRSQYIFWNAHQMILGILCETGIAGLIIFILLIYRAIRDGIKNYPETFPALLMLVDFLIAGIGGYGFHRKQR